MGLNWCEITINHHKHAIWHLLCQIRRQMDFFASKASNRHKKWSIGVELHRIDIYAIYNTRKVCLCVCLCVCVCVCVCVSVSVCVWCVWVVCVWCVCVSEWVCMCCILLVFLIKYKNYMWCVLYTHTHTLTRTHSRSLTLLRLHTRARAHTINTQKAWICVDYNSTQFDSFWAN